VLRMRGGGEELLAGREREKYIYNHCPLHVFAVSVLGFCLSMDDYGVCDDETDCINAGREKSLLPRD
jgi:hypothetical protein